MAHDVLEVAKYFLTKQDPEAGEVITPLKLQKVVYYAQAWHLALFGEPFMEAHFEAWAHGPVNPLLYNEYREHRWSPIPFPEDFDESIFNKEEQEFLDDVWGAYGRFDAKYLERLTHSELPWIEARSGIPEGEYCTTTINEETMEAFYRELSEDDEE